MATLALLFPGKAEGQAAGKLGVDAFVSGSADTAEVVITVRNLGHTPIGKLRVEVRQARAISNSQERAGLAASTASVFRLPLSRAVYMSAVGHKAQLYVLITE